MNLLQPPGIRTIALSFVLCVRPCNEVRAFLNIHLDSLPFDLSGDLRFWLGRIEEPLDPKSFTAGL